MSDAEHTPPRDPSFRRSLLRNVAGAVGLVVLVAALFAVLGMIGRADDGDPDVAIDDVPDEDAAGEGDADTHPDGDVEDPASDPGTEADDNGSAADGDAPGDDADGDDPAAGDDPSDGADGDAQPDDGVPDDASGGDEGTSGDDEPDGPTAAIDPGEISVQVLDGFGQDNGAAATAVAEQLEAAGYQVVAENPAIAYEVTTVLWTEGFEDAARQVAAEIDAAEVSEQPGNLSTEVNVHVVVGADRG